MMAGTARLKGVNNMKKFLLATASLGLAFTLAACGNQQSAAKDSSSATSTAKVKKDHQSSEKRASSSSAASQSSATSATSTSQSATASSQASAAQQTLTDNQLAVLIYRAGGYTNLTKLIRGTAPQGRQAIGSGTAASTVYYTVNGDQVTIYTLDHDSSKTTAEQGFNTTTTTIGQLKNQYYRTTSQQQAIDQAASQVTTY